MPLNLVSRFVARLELNWIRNLAFAIIIIIMSKWASSSNFINVSAQVVSNDTVNLKYLPLSKSYIKIKCSYKTI